MTNGLLDFTEPYRKGLLDFAQKVRKNPQYLLGQHLTQGLRNVGSLGRVATELLPSGDIRDALQASGQTVEQVRQGNIPQALLESAYIPASLLGVMIPGSTGGARKLLDTGKTDKPLLDTTPVTPKVEPKQLDLGFDVVPPTDTSSGIIAFHGSPHDFDKFKLEKIGTGEGAQAFGYGLYFTDVEDIAKFYKSTLGAKVSLNGKPIVEGGRDNLKNIRAMSDKEKEKLNKIGEQLNELLSGKTDDLFQKDVVINNDAMLDAKFSKMVNNPMGLSTSPEQKQQFRELIEKYKSIKDQYVVKKQIETDIRNGYKNKNLINDMLDKAKNDLATDTGERITVDGSVVKTPRSKIKKQNKIKILEDIKARDALKVDNTGKMYKVGIDAFKDDLVDLDKPINEQSTKIQKLIYKIASEPIPQQPYGNITEKQYDRINALAGLQIEIRVTNKKIQAVKELKDNFIKKLPNKEGREAAEELLDFWATKPPDTAKTEAIIDGLWDRINEAVPYSKYPNIDVDEIYDVSRSIDLATPKTLGKIMDSVSESTQPFSELFASKGIKGFKYRADQGRVKGKNNYVIFDPNLIKILSKYGIVGAVGISALDKVVNQNSDNPI